MSRLIDADAFLKRNEVYADCEFNHPKYQDTLREIIEAEPSVDAVEVKHGEWEKGIHQAECSACCEKFYFGDDIWVEDFDICEDIGWKYCPNCGAKMDGEVKNDG